MRTSVGRFFPTALAWFSLGATQASSQVCQPGGFHGYDSLPDSVPAPRNCVNLFWCHPPELIFAGYETFGCDPTAGPCTVRANVIGTFPGSSGNSTAIGPGHGRFHAHGPPVRRRLPGDGDARRRPGAGGDARGVTVSRTYDAADRVTFIDYPDPALDTTYTYDDPGVLFSQGRLTAIIRDGLSADYEYDRFGRTTRVGELPYGYDRTATEPRPQRRW